VDVVTNEPAYPVPAEDRPADMLDDEALARLEALTVESLGAAPIERVQELGAARAKREREKQLAAAERRLAAARKSAAEAERAGDLETILAPVRPTPRPPAAVVRARAEGYYDRAGRWVPPLAGSGSLSDAAVGSGRISRSDVTVERPAGWLELPGSRLSTANLSRLAEIHGARKVTLHESGVIAVHYGSSDTDDRIVYYPDAHTAARAPGSWWIRLRYMRTDPPLPSAARPNSDKLPRTMPAPRPPAELLSKFVVNPLIGLVAFFTFCVFVFGGSEEDAIAFASRLGEFMGHAVGWLVGG